MQLDPILDALADPGWIAVPEFLSPDEARALAAACAECWEEGEFRRAGVGRGESLAIREDIRAGRYQVNPERIADGLIDSVRDLLNGKKPS